MISFVCNELRGRLMVGQWPLKPFILVRIQTPQPMKTHSMKTFSSIAVILTFIFIPYTSSAADVTNGELTFDSTELPNINFTYKGIIHNTGNLTSNIIQINPSLPYYQNVKCVVGSELCAQGAYPYAWTMTFDDTPGYNPVGSTTGTSTTSTSKYSLYFFSVPGGSEGKTFELSFTIPNALQSMNGKWIALSPLAIKDKRVYTGRSIINNFNKVSVTTLSLATPSLYVSTQKSEICQRNSPVADDCRSISFDTKTYGNARFDFTLSNSKPMLDVNIEIERQINLWQYWLMSIVFPFISLLIFVTIANATGWFKILIKDLSLFGVLVGLFSVGKANIFGLDIFPFFLPDIIFLIILILGFIVLNKRIKPVI